VTDRQTDEHQLRLKPPHFGVGDIITCCRRTRPKGGDAVQLERLPWNLLRLIIALQPVSPGL